MLTVILSMHRVLFASHFHRLPLQCRALSPQNAPCTRLCAPPHTRGRSPYRRRRLRPPRLSVAPVYSIQSAPSAAPVRRAHARCASWWLRLLCAAMKGRATPCDFYVLFLLFRAQPPSAAPWSSEYNGPRSVSPSLPSRPGRLPGPPGPRTGLAGSAVAAPALPAVLSGSLASGLAGSQPPTGSRLRPRHDPRQGHGRVAATRA